jgi:hypothetical protein
MAQSKIVLLSDVIKDLNMENKEVSDICFTCVNEANNEYQCNLCEKSYTHKQSGYTNLINHLKNAHSVDDVKSFIMRKKSQKKGAMDGFVRHLDKKASQYHDWIEWIVMADQPFTFVENKYTKQNSRQDLGEISRVTLMAYMDEVLFLMANKLHQY